MNLDITSSPSTYKTELVPESFEKDRKYKEAIIEELSPDKIYEHNRRKVKVSPQDLQKKLEKQFALAQTRLDVAIFYPYEFTRSELYSSVALGASQKLVALQGGWVAALQGHRETMEDTFSQSKIFVNRWDMIQLSLFDGHSGKKCASFLEKEISKYLKDAFEKRTILSNACVFTILKTAFVYLGDQYRRSFASGRNAKTKELPGSTAVTVLKIKNTLWVANAGDSRAILVHGNGRVEALSNDHKPEREENRKGIIKRGGVLIQRSGDVVRVMNKEKTHALAMSRAVGHPEIGSGINPRASIISYDLSKLSGKNNFLIMATDGLWDVVSSRNVGLNVMETINRYRQHSTRDSIEKIVSESLVQRVYLTCLLKKIPCDNTTVMAVNLDNSSIGRIRKFQHIKTLSHKRRTYIHIRGCEFMCAVLMLFFALGMALSAIKNTGQQIQANSVIT